MEIESVVKRGNICTSKWQPGTPGRYLANGRFGVVLSGLGLNEPPWRQNAAPQDGRSLYSHMGHWGRFRFVSDATGGETTADYLLPLLRLYWAQEPKHITAYDQCQDLYDGTVTTRFTDEQGQAVQTVNWMDMVNRDLAGCSISLSSGSRVICLSAVTKFVPYPFLYKQETAQTVCAVPDGASWKLTIRCPDTINECSNCVYLYTNGEVTTAEDGLRLTLKQGHTHILLSYGAPAETEDAAISLQRTKQAWHEQWARTGWLSLPDDHAQQMWVRSTAYLLASYGDMAYGIQPTSGLSGNMFPFHFVQDMEYIAPALLMLGHGDIVKKWVEHFARQIPTMRQYAQHLWPSAQGVCPPWELPFGAIEGYHSPCVPVVYCYEPHNVGYLCRMAAEVAEFFDDAVWTQQIAKPLIQECAAFYLAFASKGTDGLWHLRWSPCVGQDEAGGQNKSDYLCSLYSARYCFKVMVRFGWDDTGTYAAILRDGLCFATLRSTRGTYHTVRGADDFGRQKHPVQLDGITYMPAASAPETPELLAYQLRHEITAGARIPFYEGWTLGQFLLAGANLGDPAGWLQDWAQMRASNYVDPDWVQIYETSGQTEKSFYMATHGMILQSLIRCWVNDYWGPIQVAACPIWRDGVAFGGIHTRCGAQVSGCIEKNRCTFTVRAGRPVDVSAAGQTFAVGAGDTRTFSGAIQEADL